MARTITAIVAATDDVRALYRPQAHEVFPASQGSIERRVRCWALVEDDLGLEGTVDATTGRSLLGPLVIGLVIASGVANLVYADQLLGFTGYR